ncbi:MAG: hypothetical protein V5A27_05410, partial [Halapricum sp.]
YIGEPDDRIDVYLGFGLFFAGIAIAFVGLVLFLYGGQFEYQTDSYWIWHRPAYALGMMSLPTTLLGVILLLPVDNRAIYSGTVGTAITYVSVVAFAAFYPDNWNVVGTDYSMQVVLVYGLGLAAVLASTAAALVAHQIERAKPGPADIEPVEEEEPEESYTDEEIQRDIEEAMEDVDITWGGIERTEGQSLKLNLEEEGFDFSGMQVEASKTISSTSTDDQVQGLKALKGGEKKTATSESTVNDQTTKLNELKQRRKEEQEQAAATAAEGGSGEGLWARLKRFLGLS